MGRGAAETAAEGSTGTTAAADDVVVGVEAAGPAGATATKRRRKRPKRPGKKQGGKLKNRGVGGF